jgi:hypothetical protein
MCKANKAKKLRLAQGFFIRRGKKKSLRWENYEKCSKSMDDSEKYAQFPVT